MIVITVGCLIVVDGKEKESIDDEQSKSVNLLSYNSSLHFS